MWDSELHKSRDYQQTALRPGLRHVVAGLHSVRMSHGLPSFRSDSIKETFLKANDLRYTLLKYLSTEAKDLISSLLTWDSEQRFTIHQTRDHPFFSPVFGLNISTMRLSPIVSRQEITYAEYSEQMMSPVKTHNTHKSFATTTQKKYIRFQARTDFYLESVPQYTI